MVNAPAELEQQRLQRLKQLALLRKPKDAVLDVFVNSVAEYCDVPIAFVSVLEADRQVLLSSLGMDRVDIPREQSLCDFLLSHDEPLLEISDIRKAASQYGEIRAPGNATIQFYAGQVLKAADGHVLGSLVIMDTKPRRLNGPQREALSRLAHTLAAIMERQEIASYSHLDNIILRTISQGVVLIDLQLENAPITYCNSALQVMTGYARAEMLGNSCFDLLGKQPDQASLDELQNALQTGSETKVRAMLPHKDGHTLWTEHSLQPIVNDDGRVSHFVCIVTDITQQQANKRALQSAQKDLERRVTERTAELKLAQQRADDANHAKSQFLATVSHDLRQPLQSLGIYLSVLGKLVETDKAQEVVSKMELSLDTVRAMLDALLDVSRLESGQVEIHPEAIALQNLFDRLQVEFEPIAAAKGVALNIQQSAATVRSDAALLQRVLDNLVSNAIKFTESGTVNITHRTHGRMIEVLVSDTGSGIAKPDQERIFGEYVQLGNPERDNKRGLGLGLSIVRGITNMLDIPLGLQSRPGVGSRFSIELPLLSLNETDSAQGAPSAEPYSSAQAQKVLLIEDDAIVAEALAERLRLEGYVVTVADNAQDARYEIELGLMPDVLISDYRLPDQNGMSLLAELRNRLEEKVPAVLLTGDTLKRIVPPSGHEDISTLFKPVAVERLLELIGRPA